MPTSVMWHGASCYRKNNLRSRAVGGDEDAEAWRGEFTTCILNLREDTAWESLWLQVWATTGSRERVTDPELIQSTRTLGTGPSFTVNPGHQPLKGS